MLRVAIGQINTTVGDLKGNADKIISAIHTAIERRARFITFPELAVTGYPPEDLLLKPSFVTDNLKQLHRIAKNTGDIIAIVGFADRVGDKIFNAAALIRDGAVFSVYHKILLPNYGVFDEKRYFEPSDSTSVFEFGPLRFGVNICEDIYRTACPAVNQCVSGRADVLFNISASPYYAGKRFEREALLRNVARSHGVTVVYTNLVGGQDELIFDGHSLVMDPGGEIIASAPQFKEEILYVDLTMERMSPDGGTGDASLELTGIGLKTIKIAGEPTAVPNGEETPLKKVRPLDRIEEIFRALCLGVREYVLKNGFKKALMGLSGGIDSALVAAIAAEALGPENVMGVTMPSVYSSEGSVSDSTRLADNLEIKLLTMPIAGVVNSFDSSLSELFKGTEPGPAEENLQARIRGTLLMAVSNKFGWLVLTTGNKSETSVGYCTLYGDMAGGYAVIKDVYKTLVYELARWLNSSRGGEVIPREIIEKPPSAELRPDQKDTDSLPPYELLDPILERYVERRISPDEIAAEGFDRELVKEVVRLVDRNEYKRRQAPPGIKITPQAFGKDRRLPIVNRYRSR